MWTEYIENTKFLIQLFKGVPELSNVVIEHFDINYYGYEIKIVIKLPQLINEIPSKWKKNDYNAAIIELDLWAVTQLNILMNADKRSDINIEKRNEKLFVEIKGGIDASFIAEAGYIQNVSGYIIDIEKHLQLYLSEFFGYKFLVVKKNSCCKAIKLPQPSCSVLEQN